MRTADRAPAPKIIPLALVVALVALATACSAVQAPVAGPTSPAAIPQQSESPAPTGSPALPSPEPAPIWEGHAGAGLALVQFIEEGSPVTQVFVVDPDGTLRQVTGVASPDSVGASRPVWSPDGSQIAFGPPKVGAGPEPFVSVVNADGSGERHVGALAEEYTSPPAWSPDGTRLLYGDIDAVDGPAMWLVDLATGEVTHLGVGSIPRWLPDGRHISFHRGVEGRILTDPRALTEVIFVMDLESGEVSEFATGSDAFWSPDGSAVLLQQEGAFVGSEFVSGDLILAEADGSNPQELVAGWSPVWSPDGSRIVFGYDHNQDGLPILAAVDLEGRELWSGIAGEAPTWSPDGSRVAVEINYPEPLVKVLDAATGEVLWETAGTQPAWGP